MASQLRSAHARVGVLGGGQLGRMMALDAARLGFELECLDPSGPAAAAAPVSKVRQGSFMDREAVIDLAKDHDVLTVEIEHVNVDALEEVAKEGKCAVHPAPSALRIISDKALQKDVMVKRGVPVVDFCVVEPNQASIEDAAAKFGGFPVMLKSRKMAYDGKGNAVVESAEGVAEALRSLGAAVAKGGVYVERWAPFKAELACIVARNTLGEVACYDVVETRQADNICRIVVVPPSFDLPEEARAEAVRVARAAVSAVEGAGVFAVEMFWMGGNKVLYNEIAPRPHNSGHLSIEACVTSQFEQHVRCVAGLPLGDTSLRVGAAAMINILGAETDEETIESLRPALSVPGAKVHWYAKSCRPGRKLGHITVTAPTMDELRRRLLELNEPLDVADLDLARPGFERPVVGIIMGSDSDLPTMKACAEVFDLFRVPYELTVVSAHRTPDRMYTYAKEARGRGIQVIVAGAGGAAHLPGMVAALTPLPVIGVPIKTSTLNGQDSLLSIVQMPRGVPVATVAIGNAMNAGLLAVRMLAAQDSVGLAARLRGELDLWHDDQRESVEEKAAHLENVKYKQYLSEYGNKDKTYQYLPRIRATVGHTLDETRLTLTPRGENQQVEKYVGKVRDRYDDGENVVLITTDRLTAFDRPLAKIPFKGQVLNQVSLWWFEQTKHIVNNQLLDYNKDGAVHPNVTLAKRCKTFPIEFVMRGYITGSSGTSLWTHYNKGVRNYCGHLLPEGLRKNEKLATNLCTPTTKSDEHDELIDAETIVKDGWMSAADWEFCERKAQELFAHGQKLARQHGLILVDTKYEFGRDLKTGEILLIDEIHTPDCSRYWIADSYDARMAAGAEPEHIDKEFIRLWYRDHCDPYKDEVLPEAPIELVCELSRRYIMLFEKITGKPFNFARGPGNGDANAAIQAALDKTLAC